VLVIDESINKDNVSSKIISDLATGSSVEDRAATRLAHEEVRFTEANQAMALKQNSLDITQVSLRNAFTLAGLHLNGSDPQSKRKAEQALNDRLFMALLNDMRSRLHELEQNMDRLRADLNAKYGEDYVGGMVETFLSDEEKAGLESEEDKMKALSQKFLNPDGTIKDKYKDTPEAQYVRDWQEAQKLRPIVQQYEGRSQLTAEEGHEVYKAAENTSLAGKRSMMALSTNESVKGIAAEQADVERDQTIAGQVATAIPFS
jgi:hypothetical protein